MGSLFSQVATKQDIPDTSMYIKTSDFNAALANYTPKSELINYASKTDLNTYNSKVDSILGTKAFIDNFTTSSQNFANENYDCTYDPNNARSWAQLYPNDPNLVNYINGASNNLKAPFCLIKGNCWNPSSGGAWCYAPKGLKQPPI